MKTVASIVEKDMIHLYLHLRYVSRPARMAKNEYHSLVSPIVLIGGRSRDIHKPAMNAVNTAKAPKAIASASERRRRYFSDEADQWSLAHNDTTDAPTANATAGTANHMKLLHVIMTQIV
jgi:hypothetical protein